MAGGDPATPLALRMNRPASAPRILIITEEFPPDCGGVAVSAERVARHLARAGCPVCVLVLDSATPANADDYARTQAHAEVEVVRLGPFFLQRAGEELPQLDEGQKARLRQRIFDQMELRGRRFRPDVVLSFYALNAGFLGLLLSRSLRVPHIAGVRGSDIGRNLFRLDTHGALRAIVEGSRRVVCVNHFLRDRLLLGFPERRAACEVVLNAVELPSEVVDGERPSAPFYPRPGLVLVFVGTAREKKGILQLGRALHDARRTADIRLLLVGPAAPPELVGRCTEWSDLVACGAIRTTGLVDRPLGIAWAAHGDVLVMPSTDDGLANGLLEGMALGLCPLVTDVFSDVVDDGVNGVVVARNSIPELSSAMLRLAADAGLRRACGARARQTAAARLAPAREAQEYLAVFEAAIREHRG